DDHDSVTWDNMERDTTNCSWVKTGGMWALTMRPAPIFDGTNRDLVGCNSRWGAAIGHASCSLGPGRGDDVLLGCCDEVGGSPGSPLLSQPFLGTWRAIGVVHGGQHQDDFLQAAPVCTVDDARTALDNGGPSVERFRDAPRFAANVAVHRAPHN